MAPLSPKDGRKREIGALDPQHRPAGVGAELLGRDAGRIGEAASAGAVCPAQRDAERLLQPDRGGERERPAARERLLQGREADLGLVGEALARDAAARELLADQRGDRPALLVGELLRSRRFAAIGAPSAASVCAQTLTAAAPRRSAHRRFRDGSLPNKLEHHRSTAEREMEQNEPKVRKTSGPTGADPCTQP